MYRLPELEDQLKALLNKHGWIPIQLALGEACRQIAAELKDQREGDELHQKIPALNWEFRANAIDVIE